MWTKQAVYRLLEASGVPHEKIEHPAVFNMADLNRLRLPHPEAEAKNLFVRDDKKRNYYLITVHGEKRVDLKTFRQTHHTRPLSFASPEELQEKLGLAPGAVTPLGLLNDETRQIPLFLDSDFAPESSLICVHPNENTATVLLQARDLVAPAGKSRPFRGMGRPLTPQSNRACFVLPSSFVRAPKE